MSRRLSLVCLAGTSILGAADVAVANDASFHGDGAMVFAMRATGVRMAREVIVIRHVPDGSPHDYLADCEFTFENRLDAKADVLMGFPDWEQWSEAADAWAIKDFATWIDGRFTQATHRKVDNDGGRPTADGQRMKIAYPAAYTWPVAIDGKGRVTVRNRYRFGGLRTNGPLQACFGEGDGDGKRGPSVIPPLYRYDPDPKSEPHFADGVCTQLQYIVTTGRTWDGAIGDADIAIQLPPDALPNLVIPLPPATEVTGGFVRWQRKDWTPTEELRVVIARRGGYPFFATVKQAKSWLEFAKANGFGADMVGALKTGYERELVSPSEYTPPITKRARAIHAQVIELLGEYAAPAALPAMAELSAVGPAALDDPSAPSTTASAAPPPSPPAPAPPRVMPEAAQPNCACRPAPSSANDLPQPVALAGALVGVLTLLRRRRARRNGSSSTEPLR